PALAPALDPGRRARRPGRPGARGARGSSARGAPLLADRPPALRRLSIPLLPAGGHAAPAARGAGGDRGARPAHPWCALPRGPVRRPERAARRRAPPGPGREPRRGALDTVAARWAGKLWPAIDRVWRDGIDGIRADLREWLRRAADADDGWVPWRFELSFGLADRDRPQADPASVPDPVPVIGDLSLRGSVDLVERRPPGVLRATDHKTGKTRPKTDVVVGGGTVLQPLLYALACERLLNEPVEAGRLYDCTADGGYEERVVPLDAEGRRVAGEVVDIIGRALADGFLPAMPAKGACRYCDYRPVCGPHEETRTARKPKDRCADLERLRRLP